MKRVVIDASSYWRDRSGGRYTNPMFPDIEILDEGRDSYRVLDRGRDIGRNFYSFDEAQDWVRYNC